MAARSAIASSSPDVVLLDPCFPDGAKDSLMLLPELSQPDATRASNGFHRPE